jgi:hypothetical protein
VTSAEVAGCGAWTGRSSNAITSSASWRSPCTTPHAARTVDNQVAAILAKLGARNRREAAARATEL